MAAAAVPDWLTTEFFQRCLQDHREQLPTVTGLTVQSEVVPDGNHYGSQLFRVKVDYKKEDAEASVSLIVKGPLTFIENILGEGHEREPKYYNQFINETYKYTNHDLVPKHYISPNPHCVVLEDLASSGYVMVNRHNLLDLEHCEMYIKAKAKLNALSVAIYKNNPQVIESTMQVSEHFTDEIQKMLKNCTKMTLSCTAAYLENKHECKEYLEIIKELMINDNFWKMYQEADRANLDKPLKALIQLDPWCTNMMFRYNSLGRVESVKLLDFQNISFASPVRELVSFLSVSPNMEVRKTKLNALHHLFCDELNKNLAELNCPQRLNFEEMKADIVALSPLILNDIGLLLPVVLYEGAADIADLLAGDIENVPITERPIYKLYQGKRFNEVFPQVLNGIAKEGVFTYLKEKLKEMNTK